MPSSRLSPLFRCLIHLGSLGGYMVSARGVGASPVLEVSHDVLDFGIIRVGVVKTLRLTIHNRGLIMSEFFIACTSITFSVEPERGVVPPNSSVEIVVGFHPQQKTQYSALMR